MSFPPGTEMFQFPGFASATYGFSGGSSLRRGLPHSETPGSKPARGSPRLFAACHVLHRLLAPRHPPDALAFLHPRQPPPQTIHPMQPAASRGPRPTRAGPRETGKIRGGGRRRRIPATTTKGPPLRGTARIPMPDARPAHRRKRPRRRAERATCRCPPRTTHGRGSLHTHARDGHLVTTSRCPNSKGLPRHSPRGARERLVGLGRLERPTSRLSGVRSNQLSYRPEHAAAGNGHPPRRENAPDRPERLLAKGRADGGGHR